MKRLIAVLIAVCILIQLGISAAHAASATPDEIDWDEYWEEMRERDPELTVLLNGRSVYKRYTKLHYDINMLVPGLPKLIEGRLDYSSDGIRLLTNRSDYSFQGFDLDLYPELYDAEYTVQPGRVSFRYTLKDGKTFDDLCDAIDAQRAANYFGNTPPKDDRNLGTLRSFPLMSAAVILAEDGRYDMQYTLENVVNADGNVLYKDEEKQIDIPYGAQAMWMPLGNEHAYGDVDMDGAITIIDATVTQQALVGKRELDRTEQYSLAAWADTKVELSILDVTAIQRYLAGLPDAGGVGLGGVI